MKKTMGLLMIATLVFVTGCSLMAVESPPEDYGNEVVLDGFTFNYKQLPIRNRKYRTDVFEIDEEGCLVMEGSSRVMTTFHEAHFKVLTDLDLCAYNFVKLNSTITSITFRESISPSSQIYIQDHKYSSHSLDNMTKELHSHNLKFYNDGTRVSWIDDEGYSYYSSCGNLTIIIRASGGENGTCMASLKICDIEVG